MCEKKTNPAAAGQFEESINHPVPEMPQVEPEAHLKQDLEQTLNQIQVLLADHQSNDTTLAELFSDRWSTVIAEMLETHRMQLGLLLNRHARQQAKLNHHKLKATLDYTRLIQPTFLAVHWSVVYKALELSSLLRSLRLIKKKKKKSGMVFLVIHLKFL